MKPKPIVIAVSAVSGGGKTTFALAAAKELDAAVLLRDDYGDDPASSTGWLRDATEWLRDGANLDASRFPQLASDLERLISWQPVKSRHDESTIEPKPIVILDEATGRQCSEMAGLIDFVVAIDTPLEIGLARAVRRSLDYTASLRSYMRWYLDVGRSVCSEIRDQVMGNCDLILDWQLPIGEQIRIMRDKFGLNGVMAKHSGDAEN